MRVRHRRPAPSGGGGATWEVRPLDDAHAHPLLHQQAPTRAAVYHERDTWPERVRAQGEANVEVRMRRLLGQEAVGHEIHRRVRSSRGAHRVLVSALSFLVAAVSGPALLAQTSDEVPARESTPRYALDRAALVRLLEQERRARKMPGLRAAVRLPSGEVVRAAVGLADKKTELSLDDDIGMPGGSTGKTFAATLTMLLVEDGMLSLDDRAARWLAEEDWFRRLPNADTMQVRHLLSHSAGIRDYIDTSGFYVSMIVRNLRRGSARYEPEELIEFVADRRPLFPVGEGFHYTDAGYLVFGRVIEAASGRDYFDLLEERILRPLELDEIRPVRESILTGVAMGYTGGARSIKKNGRMKFDPSSEWTGGGLVTTPTMLVEFFGALAEGRVVSEQSLEQMIHGG